MVLVVQIVDQQTTDFNDGIMSPWVKSNGTTSMEIIDGRLEVVTGKHLNGANGYYDLQEGLEYTISLNVLSGDFAPNLEFSIWKGRNKVYGNHYLTENNSKVVVTYIPTTSGTHRLNLRLRQYGYNDGDQLFSIDNVSITQKDISNLTIKEEKNYYPFGLQHKGYNTDIVGAPHKYGFGGKEEQGELDLEWLDFGARNYDPALGRWMNIDPLAEVYYGVNPYGYVFNNPVQLFDPDGMRVKYVREEGQSRKEFRQAKREFKQTNRQLSRDSKTHKASFKQLKKSKNTHSISFNRGKGSSVELVGTQNRETGNDTNIGIDLDQQSDGNQGNEFVIAHELQHAIEDDNGTSSPFEADIDYMSDSPKMITSKSLDQSNKNKEIDESSASHTENIIRGEVSNSRGVKIPLRATYTIGVESSFLGKYEIKQKVINVIKKNYDYYKKPKN